MTGFGARNFAGDHLTKPEGPKACHVIARAEGPGYRATKNQALKGRDCTLRVPFRRSQTDDLRLPEHLPTGGPHRFRICR